MKQNAPILQTRYHTSPRHYHHHPYKCKIHHVLFWITLSFLFVQISVYRHSKHTISADFHHQLQRRQQEEEGVAAVATTNAATEEVEVSAQLAAAASSPTKVDSDSQSSLPDWIANYVKWHREMREKFPGEELFENPNAPKLLIRTCLGLCGGLHDRLGQLPWDLYLANQTNRVLLVHWHRPVPLEEFLVPPPDGLDWRVPRTMEGFFPQGKNERIVSREALRDFRDGIPDMFEEYDSANPTMQFWDQDFPLALERAKLGSYASHKVLRHRILGHLHEDVLEGRLLALGETDMIHDTRTFGDIFRLFFQLAPTLQKHLDDIYRNLQLQPGRYSAVHCRVRHPKAFVGMVLGKDANHPADKTGLPWEGDTRKSAITTANRALECAQTLQQWQLSHDPIYFFSDSNDLVRYMSDELYNTTFVQRNADAFANSMTEQRALTLTEKLKVLARPSTDENAHIDRQKGRPASAYYGTFIDFFLAINARCVTYGVGYYAVFATKISHTSCKLLYQEEAWGGNEQKRLKAPLCKLEANS